ncbi:ER membrane protein complex subunit 4 [Copidosoma floridanum]|uniref:ER membrane protein complex subunit 4 n=1 Tax=Copidosoma floridanum TaxID=29053 RepID=UPI0006C94F7D|nr:ER membrane protein complex subunit 4 [Copidosoma floridanum]
MASSKGSKRLKWALDFSHKNKLEKSVDIAPPPGYMHGVAQAYSTDHSRDSNSNHLIMKKSWDLAIGPLKQVPMNLFIMYMAGNSISIFPIMMVGMFLIRPVKALFTLQQTFKVIEGTNAFGQKFVFGLGQVVNIMLALYKCQSMGLLPTHASDWLAFVEPQTSLEYSGGGFSYL